MTDEQKPAPDVTALPGLIAEAKLLFLMLARQLLTCDPLVVLNPQEQSQVLAYKGRGWRIALEVSAGEHGQARVLAVAVSPDGERKVLGRVAEDAPPTAAN